MEEHETVNTTSQGTRKRVALLFFFTFLSLGSGIWFLFVLDSPSEKEAIGLQERGVYFNEIVPVLDQANMDYELLQVALQDALTDMTMGYVDPKETILLLEDVRYRYHEVSYAVKQIDEQMFEGERRKGIRSMKLELLDASNMMAYMSHRIKRMISEEDQDSASKIQFIRQGIEQAYGSMDRHVAYRLEMDEAFRDDSAKK